MDSLISLLIDFISWAFRTATKKDEDPYNAPRNVPPVNQPARPANVPPPQRKGVSWEDELRRLLGDETPTRPPVLSPPINRPKPVASPQIKPAPVVVRAPVPDVVPIPVPTVQRVSTGELAKLDESRLAYERASQLDKLTAERIKKVPGQHVGSTSVVFHTLASPEVAQAVSLVKNARAVRTALIASIILGPPKALEPMQ
jgi:hypothetical protein